MQAAVCVLLLLVKNKHNNNYRPLHRKILKQYLDLRKLRVSKKKREEKKERGHWPHRSNEQQ